MLLEKRTFSQLSQKLDATLKFANDLGVHWQTTRFGEYKLLCDKAANGIYPRTFLTEERDKELLLYEAVIQCQQLIDSVGFWHDPKIDKSVLKNKLIEIMKGEARSADSQEDDAPRNYLLELTTAAFLKSKGFDVALTAVGADVLATLNGLSLTVECKRPVSQKTIERNLEKLSNQLAKRCKNYSTIGMAVLGIDRAIDLAAAMAAARTNGESKGESIGVMPWARTFSECQEVLVSQTIGAKDCILEAAKRNKRITFAPAPQIGAVILTGSVYIQNEKSPYTVKQMTLFRLNWEPQHESLLNGLASHFNS